MLLPAAPVSASTSDLEPTGWAIEWQALWTLAWPLILSNLTMTLIQATDVILMGRLGASALAASALGVNLSMMLTIFGMGLLTAASPMMAEERGRRRHSVRDIRRTFRQALWLAITITLPCWVIMWCATPLIKIAGQQPDLAQSAGLFLRGYMWSMLPFLLFQIMRHFLSAIERTGWILAVSIGGILLNAALSYALIFGAFGLPALGIFGGGLASSIVWSVLALVLAIVLIRHRHFRRFHLFGHWWHADWQRYRALVALGLPIGFTLFFEASVFAAAIYLMGLINEASVAAHAIALQLAALTFMVPLGIGQAATVRVGLGFGRDHPRMIHYAGWTAFFTGIAFMACMALVMLLFPRPLVALFIDAADPANQHVVRLAVSFLMVGALFQIFDGAQVVGAGMLRGLQDTRVPMLFAALGYWVIGVGVGALLAFPLGWQGIGIWVGLASGLAVVSLLMLARWNRLTRYRNPDHSALPAHKATDTPTP